MEYAVGPILALLLGMKFTDSKTKELSKRVTELEERIELVKKNEQELPKRVMQTVLPLAKAVNKLNQEIGLWK